MEGGSSEARIIDLIERFGFSKTLDTWKALAESTVFRKTAPFVRRIHRRQMANERTENEDGIID